MHHELTSKTAAINHKDGTVVTPSSIKGVTTPRQLTTTKEDSDVESLSSIQNSRNLNDVCFGCHGECSDTTCCSKRSSQISADVESNVADTPTHSPAHRLRDTHDPGGKVDLKNTSTRQDDTDVALKNDTNMNVSQTESILNEKEETNNIDSENGNSSPVNSPTKPKSPKSGRNKNGGGSKRSSKRLRSAEGSQEALDDQQRPRKVSSTCYDDSAEELDQLNDLSDLPQHARVCIDFIK